MITHPDLDYPRRQIEHRLAGCFDATEATTRSTRRRWPSASSGARRRPMCSCSASPSRAATCPVTSEADRSGRSDSTASPSIATSAAFDWGRRWQHDPDASVVDAAVNGRRSDDARHRSADVGDDGPTASNGCGRRSAPARPIVDDARRRSRRLSGRGVRTPVPRRRAEAGRRRSGRSSPARPADRGGRPQPAQADGVQGRVRGGPPHAAPRGPRRGRCRRRARRDGVVASSIHPILKALGRTSKVSFGSWTAPVFVASALREAPSGHALRPVRANRVAAHRTGTGRGSTSMRWTGSTSRSTVTPWTSRCEIAGLPDHVRGYEDLKLRRVAEYRDRLYVALDALARRRAAFG